MEAIQTVGRLISLLPRWTKQIKSDGRRYCIYPARYISVTEAEIMEHYTAGSTTWSRVFKMSKSGTGPDKRICYSGYKNERPVFDLSAVKPENERVIVFYVSGSYLHFRNIEVVGTQVTIVGHTQSGMFPQ